ncbi:MAG: glycosyl transferase family 1 [Candidatus Saccharibacteria bacterium]|nr:glycosyl transferase family 1 [Candidatus Saccharibacteria bacterium]
MSNIVIDGRELTATGTGTYLKHLLSELQQLDRTNSYVVLLKPKDMEDWQPTNKNFTKVGCSYKEFTFGEQIGLRKQLKHLQPDLVHFAMVQQPVLYRGRTITTMHDLTTARFRNPSKNWLVFIIKQALYKWVNRIAARKSKAILTPSAFVKDDVARFARINSRKITVTYLAADKITEAPEAISELEGKSYVMYVGRPQPHKNLSRLVEAFVQLRQQYPELHLVLVGKRDALYRRLDKQLQNQAIKNVHFMGFMNDGQLRWLYEHTKAYVFPSLSEGFGLPGLEAMAHDAPVVSSNATCLPEIYGDAAEYFDPLDVKAMIKAIAKVIDDDKRADQLRSLGKKQVATYSWQRTAEQTLAVYKRVLNDELPPAA